MLCEKLEKLENLPKDYVIQIKLDGSRAIYLNGKLLGRQRKSGHRSNYFETMNIRHIQEALKPFNVVLDGELCVFDNKGISHLNLLLRKENQEKAVYVVFDILKLNGEDLTNKPLKERIEILADFCYEHFNLFKGKIEFLGYWNILDNFKEIINNWYEMGLEGFIAKDRNSPYIIDWNSPLDEVRTRYWLKFKFWKTLEVEVLGLTDKEHHAYGSIKTSHGDVGLLSMENRLYFEKFKPKKAKVRYLELTESNKMRKPILVGWINESSERNYEKLENN